MYLIEMSTNIGKIEKWLSVIVKNKAPPIKVLQLTPDLSEHGRNLNEHDLNEAELYSSNTEEEHAPSEPTAPRYYLGPR